jgi:putative NADPH-quinone reductase
MEPNYLISIARSTVAQKGTIHDPGSKLKVRVIDMVKSKFKPSQGEVQYFVTAGDETLAFETQGYNKHRTLLILQMIASYCMYLGLLEARIHATLPY